MKLVNTNTGERLDITTAPIKDVSDALLAVDSEIKALKAQLEAAKEYLSIKRVDSEGKFGDWSVSTASRTNYKLPKETKEKIEEIKKSEGELSLTQYYIWKRPKHS